MGGKEENGEPKDAIQVEEILRQPNMWQRNDVVRLVFSVKPLDPARH
jgi:hypothetical protein